MFYSLIGLHVALLYEKTDITHLRIHVEAQRIKVPAKDAPQLHSPSLFHNRRHQAPGAHSVAHSVYGTEWSPPLKRMSMVSIARDNIDGGLLEIAPRPDHPSSAISRELSAAYMAVFPDTSTDPSSSVVHRISPARSFNNYSDGIMDLFILHEYVS